MIRIKTRHQSKIPENVLPLVNVVFLLLIFFMLAGAFSSPDLFNITAPSAKVERLADRKELTVLMDKNGKLALKNSIVDDQTLKAIVIDKLRDSENLELQLKADARADATRLIKIIQILNTTELHGIRLLTVNPNE